MNHTLTLDNVAIPLHEDEGYFSGSEATITPPLTPPPAPPTNTPALSAAVGLEEPPQIDLNEPPAGGPDAQPSASLPNDLRNEEPGPFWPETLTMVTALAVMLLLTVAVFPRPPEAFNLVAVHLVWAACAVYGFFSPGRPRAIALLVSAVMLPLLLGWAAVAVVRRMAGELEEPRRRG